MQREANLL
jgi:sRNA-binding carbon storage regulator CsrA